MFLIIRIAFLLMGQFMTMRIPPIASYSLILFSTFPSSLSCWRYKPMWVSTSSMVSQLNFRGWGLQPQAKTPVWRAKDYTSSGPYPFTCLEWVAPSGDYAPANIALRVIGARKPPLHEMAVVLEENFLYYSCIISSNSIIIIIIRFTRITLKVKQFRPE